MSQECVHEAAPPATVTRGSPGPAILPSPSLARLSPSEPELRPPATVPLIPWSELRDMLGKVESSPLPSAVPPWFLSVGGQIPPQGMDTGGPGIEPSSSKGNTSAHCLGGEGGEGEKLRVLTGQRMVRDGLHKPQEPCWPLHTLW